MDSLHALNANSFFALVNKPQNISSFNFANKVKRSLNLEGFQIQKVGFLGTLDPFASGNLLLAFNSCTKLLNHIAVDSKNYIATVFFGLDSKSIDIENITDINIIETLPFSSIKEVCDELRGPINYIPPKFSAKHIDGVRAYKLARENKEVKLKMQTMDIKNFKILNYSHPFLSFEVGVSKGGYIRSICEIIVTNLAQRLGQNLAGSLCYLHRISDGEFSYKNMDSSKKIALQVNLNRVLEPVNLIVADIEKLISYDTIKLVEFYKFAVNGQKFNLKNLKPNIKKGIYLADFNNFYSIIEVENSGEIRYILNRISKC